ncbi:hypothetical protein Rrhod_2060 [Rhodococcus rhodnii LMG 5362]|uniref:Uncharacterized protein n=1 Tax=Rhodococcus rhodnii LMG 5362 TaxID=1273125 RepID=R7WMZ0_9NOCA|nr:hypothetical protein Rrhod_2060 [Rhodococcus rhodnii LMG 5362]
MVLPRADAAEVVAADAAAPDSPPMPPSIGAALAAAVDDPCAMLAAAEPRFVAADVAVETVVPAI